MKILAIILCVIFSLSSCKPKGLKTVTPGARCSSYMDKGISGNTDYVCLYDNKRVLRWLPVT